MSGTLIGMLIVFVSMLPSVPVRVYVARNWQHLFVKAEWAFIVTCMLLFAPAANTDPVSFFGGYFGIVAVAPLAGLLVSMGVAVLIFGSLPQTRNPPTDNRYYDPLFDWSREAVEYKIKRRLLPYAFGVGVAIILYVLFRHWNVIA